MTREVPAELTTFVGRRKELAEGMRMLRAGRLVTLVGPGGVGKTRLAGRLARQAGRAFLDGLVWVDLAALKDPASLPGEIAGALGLDARGQSVEDAVAAYLEARGLLLVMDNCEHLVDASAELVARFLAAAPDVRVLATSRQPLALEGEHLLTVPPLSVPSPEDVASGPIGHVEAVALLVDRASAVDRGFQVDRTNAELIARLCRRLDGVPLAIELAAARLRVLSLSQLVERLDDRFAVLTSGPRGAELRHQTLRGLIDWSFELCSPDEQVLWARMSVFEGSCDLDAVEVVCADSGASVFDAVAGLVDKSVLVPEEVVGRVRYRMLETVRDYGHSRLAQRGEIEELVARHRDYFVSSARTTELSGFGPQQRDRFIRTAADLQDLRAAHEACLAAPETLSGAVVILSSLWWHWVGRGALDEGIRWADRTFSGSLEPDAETLRSLIRAAWLAVLADDRERAHAYAEKALGLAAGLGRDVVGTIERSAHALLAFVDGNLQDAIDSDRGSLGEPVQAGMMDAEVAVVVLLRTSLYLAWTGRPAEALDDLDTAVRLCQQHSEEWWRSLLLCMRAARLADLGRHDEALGSAREALEMAHGLNAFSVVNAVEMAAQLNSLLDHSRQAAVLFGAVARLWPGNGSSLLVEDRARHEAGEQHARELLGEADYAVAYERGRSMTVDEVVFFVLGTPTESSTRGPARSDTSTPSLSRRELEVADLIARGLANKDIAEKLVISPRTAEGHVARLLDKLGFTSRARVAAWVAEQRALDTMAFPGAQPSSVLP